MKTIALRFSDNFAPKRGTIAAHQELIDRLGFVWYGKMGTPVSESIANEILAPKHLKILLIHSGTPNRYWATVSSIQRNLPPLYQSFSSKVDDDKENINDDLVFEIELIRQIEVNIDYILMLVAKYYDSNCTDKEILTAIDKAINSSIELRSKKVLIEGFIARVNVSTDVDEDWQRFVREQKETDLNALIEEEKLKPEATRRFIDNALRDGALKTTGTDMDSLLPPISRFGGGRAEKKQTVIDKLMAFFEKYLGLGYLEDCIHCEIRR